DEDAHEGPDAGAIIDGSRFDDRRAARRPGGDEPLVAEDFPIARPTAMLPEEAAVIGVDAVEMAVVTGEVDAVLTGDGSEADGAIGEEGPELLPGLDVEGLEPVVLGGGEEEAVPADDGVIGGVELHFGLIEPGGRERRVVARPLQMQRVG